MNDKRFKRDRADELLAKIQDYLETNGWKLDEYTLFMIDPITKSSHHTMTALNIQLDRDLAVSEKPSN